MYYLLGTITANGNGTAWTPGATGKFELLYHGTWDSGTVKLQQLSPDGATWVDVTSTVSANGRTATLELFHRGQLRTVAASIATLASIKVYVCGLPASGVTREDNTA